MRVMDRSPAEAPGGMEEVRSDRAADAAQSRAGWSSNARSRRSIRTDRRALKEAARCELEAGIAQGRVRAGVRSARPRRARARSRSEDPSRSEQTRPLASPDGTLRIVLARTNQPDLGAHACQDDDASRSKTSRQRVLASWGGPPPQILVTGRTPYVGELSGKMRRRCAVDGDRLCCSSRWSSMRASAGCVRCLLIMHVLAALLHRRMRARHAHLPRAEHDHRRALLDPHRPRRRFRHDALRRL